MRYFLFSADFFLCKIESEKGKAEKRKGVNTKRLIKSLEQNDEIKMTKQNNDIQKGWVSLWKIEEKVEMMWLRFLWGF